MGLIARYRRIAILTLPLLGVWGLTVVAAWLLLAGHLLSGAIVAILQVLLLWWRRQSFDAAVAVPALSALTVALGFAGSRLGPSGPFVATAAVLLLLIDFAAPVGDHVVRPKLSVHRLEAHVGARLATLERPVFTTGCAGGACLAAASSGAVPPALALGVFVVVLLLGGTAAGYQLLRARRHLPEVEIRAALAEYAPDYYVYFSGRAEAAYQVSMWLPYLERTRTRGALLIRERAFLPTALSISSMPVILAEAVEPLEHAMVPSLGAVFYVNNAAKNADGTRYRGPTHVHLGHGDSEKPPSYAASTAMFDRIFVAGQAGVDRFARHGVLVPQEKFVLVGRPQVEEIEVREAGTPLPARPVVLYAPTYRGTLADMQLSSLGSGERIVAALLAAGADVIFRPHPFSSRDAASRVLVQRIDALLAAQTRGSHVASGDAARQSVFACMNSSDALIGDVSSVLSDYLYSNKPLALACVGGERVLAGYPLARGTSLLPLDGDLEAAVSAFVSGDAKAGERSVTRTYYLGPWAVRSYPSVFVEAARRVIRDGQALPAREPLHGAATP